MLSAALIVFREVLEAALIIGIVMAATREVAGRGWWVGFGMAAGVAGAALVAAFAGTIAAAAEGMGQEIFNAAILFLAVGMLGWHNIWMSRHGRAIAQEMQAVGRAVAAGSRPMHGLALVVGIAVLREGSEVILFLYGIAVSEGGRTAPMLLGGALGLAAGAALGAAMYGGLVHIPARHLFTVTSWLILLLAAGMASQGAAALVQAGLLPTLGERIWDTSALLSENSAGGRVLHALIGYAARPTGIQVLFYLLALGVIGGLMHRLRSPHPPVQHPAPRHGGDQSLQPM